MSSTTTIDRPLIEAIRMNLNAPGGRPLLSDLTLSLGRERVALIGRNGVGKSTLLGALAAGDLPGLVLRTAPLLVPQELAGAGMSRGELRKLHLVAARRAAPEVLLLDEPTQDLDEAGRRWLEEWLAEWTGGLMVASHDRRLLRLFRQFFIIAESGARCFEGSFYELERDLERERAAEQKKYLRKLNVLAEREQHNETINQRRQRKKNLGRLHEEARMPTSAQLHGNKSYAEASQGKAAKIRKARINAARELVRSSRRALAVDLPLEWVVPPLPEDDGRDVVRLEGVHTLRLGARDRLGVMGPNGAGKTTLLQVMLGQRAPSSIGSSSAELSRIGSIAQGATDWSSEESLLLRLSDVASPDAIAQLLIAHRFPLALAERRLSSLSPGERVRAALIALMRRSPPVEMLVLDEPTASLDLLGTRALADHLRSWPGGLVIASHDAEFLEMVGIDEILHLGVRG